MLLEKLHRSQPGCLYSQVLPLAMLPDFAVAVKGDRCEGVLLRVAGTWVGEWAGLCPLE